MLEPEMADDDYCYLTTRGRVSGRPHTIEIWFGLEANRLYMLAGNREKADWVRNLRQTPRVDVRIRDQQFAGQAAVVEDGTADQTARTLLVGKYGPRYNGDLTEWGRTSLVVAVDLEPDDAAV